MASNKSIILLFEDDSALVAQFKSAVKPLLGTKLALEAFPFSQEPVHKSGTFEDQLEIELKRREDFSRIVLIVTDRDLSAGANHWRGLSEAAVSRAARAHGLPVACYRQANTGAEDRLRRAAGDGLIELPKDMVGRARHVVALAKGFIELQRLMEGRKASAKKKRASQSIDTSPGMLLARILGQPVVASRLDTFACRDETAIAEIMRASGAGDNLSAEQKRRMVVALGVWLADLVMVYPGVLLNEVAAASYLDIDPASFRRSEVRALFASAEYSKLPFADDGAPLWWRHLLDDVLLAAECESGLDVCKKMGLRRVKFCPCSVDPKLHAGYYCMATFKPLSGENSSGRVKWFPQGADLARINKRTYLKLAPWIGS